MAKTIDLQVQKSRMLIEGLRANISEFSDKGISLDDLDRMNEMINKLDEANKECDAIRESLRLKVKDMNDILQNVKTDFAEKKKIVKGYYLQEQWAKYGVMDKR